MRDSIVRALLWALRILLPARGHHRSQHRPAVPAPQSAPPAPPAPSPFVICGPHKPIPAHVLARTMPIPDDTRPVVPLYLAMWEQELERHQQHERRRAIMAALDGRDYPYSYPGAPFTAMTVTA